MRAWSALPALLSVVCVVYPVPASAQPAPRPPAGPPRVEVSILGLYATGGDLGSADATLIGNQTPTGSSSVLFRTGTRLVGAPVADVRVAVRLTRALLVEGGIGYGRPDLRVRVSGDVEGAPDITAASRLTQVTVEGGAQYRFGRGRLTPFVMGGGGYLRQLDDPRTTLGTGQVYFGGGGARYGLGAPRRGGGYTWALRGDVRVVGYRGGIIEGASRPVGLVAGAGVSLGL